MPTGLNANHERVLVAMLAHIDGLLRDAASAATSVPSPFSNVLPDLEKVEIDVLTDYLRQARIDLVEAARALELRVPPPHATATAKIQTSLAFAGIALDDAAPKRLRGYGQLGADAEALVERVEGDLARTLRRISAYLTRRGARDLAGRLERLAHAPFDLELLRLLQDVVARRGLVEYRPAIESLVEQAESRTFEVACFGRVSSGKSSLLNAVLATDVLPVGVTPVTAVPTRVVWGETPGATIHYADREPTEVPIERIGEFVSEAGNPHNEKHVVRAVVRLPSVALRGGVAFVDTPGVGSLATSGARETFAYLPRCDLGVLLIAAGGTLEREDVGLVRLLHEAGIPATVVISKCDLLTEPERVRFRDYVGTEIAGAAGVQIPVHVVSVAQADVELAQRWFQSELGPVLANARGLAEESARRKLAALREQVVATLEALGRPAGFGQGGEAGRAAVERLVLAAEGSLAQARRESDAALERTAPSAASVLGEVAALVAAQIDGGEAVDLRAAFQRVADRQSEDARSALRGVLLVARDRLAELLSEMSAELGWTSRPEPVLIDLLNAPTARLPDALLSLPARSASWLERHGPMRQRRLLSELEEDFGDAVEGAVRAWKRELADWAAGVLNRLGEQFDAQAGPMRAQARRRGSDPQSGDADGIAADLAAIRERASA